MPVWALGLSCEPLAASGPPGFHTTARELQTRTFEGSGEKTPKERQKERNGGGGGKKKKRKILGLPTLRGPTMTHRNRLTKIGLAGIGLAKIGLAKVGLFRFKGREGGGEEGRGEWVKGRGEEGIKGGLTPLPPSSPSENPEAPLSTQ